MKRELNPSFYAALAGAGRKTTPAELAKQGVRRLRTYKMSEVSFLIERALNKTLAQRMLQPLPPEEMAELSSAVEQEFKKQLGNVEELRESRGELNKDRDSAKRALAKFRHEVELRRAKQAQPTGGRELLAELNQALKPLADQSSGPDWLTKGVVSDLHTLVEARVSRALERERKTFETETRQLERRIAKLVGTTENMERALGSMARTKELEPGIASIYRTAQGLANEESQVEQKRAMMSDIFKANLELRQQIQLAPSA